VNKILVAYGTKYGGTAEIAERIGQVLREAGLTADVLPADRAGDLAAYGAVVLGSAVYVGAWRKEASNFLKANAEALADKMVWLFSSGPTGEGEAEELLEDWRLPKGLLPIAEQIQPRDIAVFHGVVDGDKLSWIEGRMLKMVKAASGDFRDWDGIAAWATGISEAVKAEGGTG
jgi:menaquinone-dependent protoporphyrinogen oxidase